MSERIGLVACCDGKLDVAARARDLYLSPLFRLSLQVAERDCRHVYVVSAKHGLVGLDQVVEPYNMSLVRMPIAQRLLWGHRVVIQLVGRHGTDRTEVFLYAGSAYVEPIVAAARPLRLIFMDQMKGLQIGQRLSWLSAQVRSIGA